jgi:sucrose-6-phosphate hydrolase SacC (GH32 family)
MLGDFDGQTYIPKYGKYRNTYGAHYAAQTYNNHPGGKRIQIGWGRIESTGMPFNQMMCFPTELTLRTTNEGIRLFSEPIDAIEKLHSRETDLSGMGISEANGKLAEIDHDLLHVRARIESLNGSRISIAYKGNHYLQVDADEINGVQTPLPDPGRLLFDVEMLIDRTSVESYCQNGKIVFVEVLKDPRKQANLEIMGDEKNMKIHHFKVYELKSIWK